METKRNESGELELIGVGLDDIATTNQDGAQLTNRLIPGDENYKYPE